MAGSAIAKFATLRVKVDVRCGHKLTLGASTERLVYARQQSLRARRMLLLRVNCYLHHRGNQGRGYSMPRDIRDKQTRPGAYGREKLVEVTCDGSHGCIARCDGKVRRDREAGGQNGKLNALRDLQLLVQRGQPPVAIECPRGRNVAHTAKEQAKPIGLYLEIRMPQKVSRVCPNHKADKDDQPGAKHNYFSAYVALSKCQDDQRKCSSNHQGAIDVVEQLQRHSDKDRRNQRHLKQA